MSLSKAKVSELDYLFKNNASNKVKTDTSETPILADNEQIYTAKIVTGDNVWLSSSKLKEGGSAALAASIVVKRDFIRMLSVHISDIPALVGIAWDSGLKNWVDPSIDPDFAPKFQVALSTAATPLVNANSSIIDSTSECPFVFDYKTGILTFLDAPYNANGYNLTQLNGTNNNTQYSVFVSGYTYSGRTLDDIKGLPVGGVQGQVLTKNSTIAYDSVWSDPGLSWKDDFIPNITPLAVTNEIYAYNNIAYASVTDTILPIDNPPNKILFQYPGLSNDYYTVDPAYKSTYQSLKIYATDSANSQINVLTKAPLSTTATRSYTSSVLSTQTDGSYLVPTSICFDEFSKIYAYILDSGNNTIKRLVVSGPTNGTVEDVILYGETLDGGKRIIINSTGLILYVSDLNGVNGSIKKIVLSLSSMGQPIGTVSTIATWEGCPVGLVLDNTEKYIYACDIVNHTVSQILVASPNTRVNFAGKSGTSGNAEGNGESARFNAPTDITIDYLGLLYVSDTGNDSIRTIEVASTGGIAKTFAPNISSPAGISVDSFKNVYVASNGSTNQILKISPTLSQTVLATGTTSLTGICIPKVSDINFYYQISGSSNGIFANKIATYPKYSSFNKQPILFPYVSQYMMEIVPIYFRVYDNSPPTSNLTVTINLTETPGTIQTSFNNRIDITSAGIDVYIDNAVYSIFKYTDNPEFTKTSMSVGDSLRIYRVGSVLRVCVISGVTQLTMANIDLSEINSDLTRNFTFDVNYDIIPIFLSGLCQYARFTIYKLPILERITDRIPDTTVYASWHQTYSPSQDSSYTAGSIIQGNNSLYIRSNIPNTAILDRTLNSPIYESSFKGSPGFTVGTGDADGNGLGASFSDPTQISYDELNQLLYLLDKTEIKTINIGSSPTNPPVVSRISNFNAVFGLDFDKIYKFNTTFNGFGTPFLKMSYALKSNYILVDPSNGTSFAGYSYPSAITPDGQGNLYVAGSSLVYGPGFGIYGDPGNYVAKYSISSDTLVPILFTVPGYTDGPLPSTDGRNPSLGSTAPGGIAYDPDTKTIYVSDPDNHSIRAINSSGPSATFISVTTIAGSGLAGYRDDFGRQAQFNNPQGITLDLSGNLYICDYGNKLIRKLNIISRVVTTVAGIYGSSGFIDGTLGTSTLTAPKSITYVPNLTSMYFTETGINLVRSLDELTNEVRTVAGNIDVLKDLYTIDKKIQKIINPAYATYMNPNGVTLGTNYNGTSQGYIPYLTFPGGSILEFSVFSNSNAYLQIDASVGGYTYFAIGRNGAYSFDGGTTYTPFAYSGGYTWQTGDTLRVIKQPYYIYVQYIRNNVVTNVLGFDTPIYNPGGFQQETKFAAQIPANTFAPVTSHLVEYPLPVWDLLLTDSSANVTDNFSVAVGTGTNSILYSANGLAWFPVSGTQFTISGSRVAWDGTLWFAVGSGTDRVIWSSNGTNWSTAGLVVPSTFTAGNDVASNGSLWLAVGTGTTPVIRSTTSLDWNAVTVTGLTTGKTVAWNGSSWVLGGVGTSSMYSSSDGTNWTAAVSGAFSIECNGVATNGRDWVAVGKDANSSTVAYSSNGSSWTNSVLFTTRGNGVSWNGKIWIAVGEGTDQIYYSTTGTSWSRVGVTTFGSSSIGNSIAWNSNLWIATGTWYSSDNSSVLSSIITSPDGLVWSPIYGSPFTGNLASGCASRKPLPNSSNSIVSSKGMFVYSGNGSQQTIPNSTVTSTSNIMITLVTASPSVPSSLVFVSGITAGTGFSVKGVSGDTSSYNYIIL